MIYFAFRRLREKNLTIDTSETFVPEELTNLIMCHPMGHLGGFSQHGMEIILMEKHFSKMNTQSPLDSLPDILMTDGY